MDTGECTLKDRLSARISTAATKNLNAYMTAHDLNKTDALNAILEAANVEAAPIDMPMYHAEVSEAGDMVKCPLGKNKGLWVRESVCRNCQETQCDIKR